jgi:hypothetical protein
MGQFDNIKSKEHRHVRRTPLELTVPAAGRRKSASFRVKSYKIPAEGSPRLLRAASGAGIPLGEKKRFVPRESLWENDAKVETDSVPSKTDYIVRTIADSG